VRHISVLLSCWEMNQAYRWFGVGVGLAALPVVPQCECGTGGRQAVPLHLMQPRSPAFATIVGGQAQGERRPAPAGVGPGLSPELADREGGGAVAAVSDRRTGAAVSDRRRRSEIDATMTAVGTPPLQRAAVEASLPRHDFYPRNAIMAASRSDQDIFRRRYKRPSAARPYRMPA
jgi:hypothetical protein